MSCLMGVKQLRISLCKKSSQHVFVLSKCLFSVCLEEILYEKMNVN